MTITWKKSSAVTGYQIQYSTSKTFSKAVTKTVKSYKTTSLKVNNLTVGKTYYVRIRTYRKYGGSTYYSKWSTAKHVKIKK